MRTVKAGTPSAGSAWPGLEPADHASEEQRASAGARGAALLFVYAVGLVTPALAPPCLVACLVVQEMQHCLHRGSRGPDRDKQHKCRRESGAAVQEEEPTALAPI